MPNTFQTYPKGEVQNNSETPIAVCTLKICMLKNAVYIHKSIPARFTPFREGVQKHRQKCLLLGIEVHKCVETADTCAT